MTILQSAYEWRAGDRRPTGGGAPWFGPRQGQVMAGLHERIVPSPEKPWRSDRERFGVPDKWVADDEGDCEDRALWLLLGLAEAGFPPECLAMYHVVLRLPAANPAANRRLGKTYPGTDYVGHAVAVVVAWRHGFPAGLDACLVSDIRMTRVVPWSAMRSAYHNPKPVAFVAPAGAP